MNTGPKRDSKETDPDFTCFACCWTQVLLPAVFVVLLAVWWQLSLPPMPLPAFQEDSNVNWVNYQNTSRCLAPVYDVASAIGVIQGFFMNSRQSSHGECIVGSGMSTAPLCCENDKKVLIISGQGLWGVNWIDVRQKLVEVQAGAQISYITSKLAEKGLALAHQPSFTEISIAGALQTATHGSYVSGPSLASSVVSLDIFYANSSKATLTREKHGEFFEAAITGLGAIGFLDTVTLRVVPLTNYARADYSLPVEEVVSHQSKIDDLLAKHPHWLSLQLSPLCDNVFVRTASPHVGQDDSSPLQKLISSPWAKHGMRVLQPALRLAAATTGSTTSAIMQGVCAAMSLGASSFVENQSRAVLVSRAAHERELLAMFGGMGHTDITVGTADKLQGGQWPVVIALDPIAGEETFGGHQTSMGRLVVMTSRHSARLTWAHSPAATTRLADEVGGLPTHVRRFLEAKPAFPSTLRSHTP